MGNNKNGGSAAKKTLSIIGIIICSPLTLISFIALITGFTSGASDTITIAIIFLLLFGTGEFFSIRYISKNKEPSNKPKNTLPNFRTINCKLKHTYGLPVMQNTKCRITGTVKGIQIFAQGTSFMIERNKIVDVSKQKEIQTSTQQVSSAGGAVAGALMFGALGAMVGGRAKSKKITTRTNYLVITYKKDDSIQYIAFEYLPKAQQLIRAYKQFSNTQRVTL